MQLLSLSYIVFISPILLLFAQLFLLIFLICPVPYFVLAALPYPPTKNLQQGDLIYSQ